MNIRKFFANTTREALNKVKDTLGPDAVILSNRRINGNVEILALANDEVQDDFDDEGFQEPGARHDANFHEVAPPVFERKHNLTVPEIPLSIQPSLSADMQDSENTLMLMQEIKNLRALVESRISELVWSQQSQRNPEKTQVLRQLLANGVSPSLARYLVEKIPVTKDESSALAWIKAVLIRNLAIGCPTHEIISRGGVFALVGPTGVGKTTTTAKLAARCVMQHGAKKLALITTDGFRVGGHEQLRIYGKIMGVMVHSVRDEADLRIAINELKNKQTILIDTVGVSQRDQAVARQIALLANCGADVKRLLCLNANASAETLNEVVHAYSGKGVAGALLTKLDEAVSLGGALDVLIRHKLPLLYVSSGQRVPEDLHQANHEWLVEQAFQRSEGVDAPRDDELGIMMGQARSQLCHGVHLG